MRRTIITPNRFTTSTRSWQVKAGGALLCFILFVLFSCVDDAAYLGLRKDPRLNARYIDIPLHPTTIQFDGILTRNINDDGINRILVGQYNDPQFGTVVARGFSNYAPPIFVVNPSAAAVLDSLVLQLRLDFYHYGSSSSSTQKMQVFEVLDTLTDKGYYNNSDVNVAALPIAEKNFTINTAQFENAFLLNSDQDTSNNVYVSIRIPIGGSLGPDLLEDLRSNQLLVTNFDAFRGKYKGFSFVIPSTDKVLGFVPTIGSTVQTRDTRLSLYYTDAGTQVRADFPLYYSSNFITGGVNQVVSFSKITADRSGTSLNGIQSFKDFTASDSRTYIQSGTSLFSKIDLTDFYKYADTLNYATFNSAEIVVTNVSTQKAPFSVQLRFLDDENRFRSYFVDSLVNDTLKGVFDPYITNIRKGVSLSQNTASPTIDVQPDVQVLIPIDEDYKIGTISVTEFIQQIYNHRADPRRIKSLALMPEENEFRKSLDVLILDPDAHLRIYYSTPVTKIH